MKEKCPPVAVSLYKQAGNKELSSSECWCEFGASNDIYIKRNKILGEKKKKKEKPAFN
jgi:hypothetical protein